MLVNKKFCCIKLLECRQCCFAVYTIYYCHLIKTFDIYPKNIERPKVTYMLLNALKSIIYQTSFICKSPVPKEVKATFAKHALSIL